MDRTPTPLKAKRPGGARPIPGSRPSSSGNGQTGYSSGSMTSGGLPKLSIPSGNVPGMNVDQAGQGGWHQSSPLPSLALRAMRPSTAPSSTSRPKLSLPTLSSTSLSSGTPPPKPSRPPLLSAPSSAQSYGQRSAPNLKLAIPGMNTAGPGFSAGHDYPVEPADDPDSLASALRTPIARDSLSLNMSSLSLSSNSAEDTNPTLQARGRDYDGDGESSYGYGRMGNGLEDPGGDVLSAMTEDIRQALNRSRFDERSSGRSRAGSMKSVASNDDNKSTPGRSSVSMSGRNRSDSGAGSISGRASRPHSSQGGHIPPNIVVAAQPVGCDEEAKKSPVFQPEDLQLIKRLGEGTGGSVDLVQDRRTGKIMAKKVITRTANPAIHKQLLRELEILNSCDSPYIVDHYGSFLTDLNSSIGIVMEYCEAGSLDSLLQNMKKKNMRCSEHVLGRVASSVLRGLDYLHQRRIVHRDIKPSNIVVTKGGAIKLCDFGVSGELVESLAGTFTGTSFYMAPERIQNKPYSIKADVWSLGMTLHEIAHLRFPFPAEGEDQNVAPIELLSYIVTAPVPVMVDDPSVGRVWSDVIKDFMAQCLIRSGTDRPYPWQLLQHPFIIASEAKKVNMAKWVAALCGWPLP
ncbi:hypothetical protein I350_04269 [Cryptococcus amylolentus CBS 6273]|uniref:Protein kinase domain-containing protein n=1 Tax=Cryptococcus amylolentus CBS 6273 TaxID=1296118 RepID=A0A1E3K175_9TREE|nr:hypothetical protein I350_04269 [Cryptococcus amylolentus CBS 6273]